MKWVKAPEELKVLLEIAMKGINCEKRPMFGYPAYFINKNMFTGLFQDQLFVRLSAELLRELQKKYPSIQNLQPMPGRPMKDYYVLPQDLRSKPAELSKVISRSAVYTRTLPPKVKKPKQPKK
jgi:TfoX/Sxy family transcriptional regulator of competence genes